MSSCGLVLSYPFLGASPDGLVLCECCGTGALELKCPYSPRDKNFIEIEAKESFSR